MNTAGLPVDDVPEVWRTYRQWVASPEESRGLRLFFRNLSQVWNTDEDGARGDGTGRV